MGLKPRHTEGTIRQRFEANRLIIDQLIMTNLSVLGVKAVNHARRNRGYTDRTGNLVNSTGFVVLHNGVNVFEDFKVTFKGAAQQPQEGEGIETVPQDGTKVGKDLAMEIAGEFANFQGWALIVVAGMHYAATVEHLRGKNVLAATELYIRVEMPKTIAKIKKAFKSL